ncbi:Universal stress protein family 1 [Photobacterium marinum]|uniref:Universal stress protein family 1 n=1 Tax=Photobacterium marinum TaxID=1056511 RepID=L8JD96_9GAMM|nr:universal stress protein [Photobacterium marinum]ELR66233.1 Universal stress protein family 1 [Photobacterium marinum]
MTFRRILIPVLPEQDLGPSFHQALEFANNFDASLTLLTIIEDLAELKELASYSITTLDLLDKTTQAYYHQLNAHTHELKKQYPRISFNTLIRVGIPFIEIIKAANENQTDLIIIDTHLHAKTTTCQWGSTTRHLMRKSNIPIWSVHEKQQSIKRIVAAIDVTTSSSTEFNEKIISIAHEFSAICQAELLPCHAWRLETEGYLRKWNSYTDLDIALVAKQLREDRADRLKSLISPYEASGTQINIRMLEGDPKQIVPQFVKKEDIDLVVMGSLSRTGIAGLLMGNSAEYMLDALKCSVVTIKPDDFCSPVLS